MLIHSQKTLEWLTPERFTHYFGVAEALTNAAKHADATTATVRAHQDGHSLFEG